ncbi:MAG: ribonuclease E/G [Paracoccaceae bacterium]
MKGRLVLLGQYEGRKAAALMENGRLEDLLVDSDAPRPGTIYRARPGRPMKGQGGLFVTTPDGAAYLRQLRGIPPGKPLLVQVTGYAEPGKAIPVTTRLMFKSRYAIVTPGAPGMNVSRSIRDEARADSLRLLAREVAGDAAEGLILRSACAEAEDDAIAADIAAMVEIAGTVCADLAGEPETLLEGDGPHALAWRDWAEPSDLDEGPDVLDAHGVLDAIEALRNPEVALSGGASLCVEPTRALVAVDVNTGTDSSPAAGLKANLAAIRELPRQLRLRGLGGQITVDLAPMSRKDRQQLETALRAAFRRDPVETAFLGWTPSGHLELQRQRARPPLEVT